MAKHLFFLGKGGVGKSTVSALTALQEAQKGKDVLLVSLDPAHNLSDIFDCRLSDKPVQLKRGLNVGEADLSKWIKKYLHQVEDRLKKSYQYLNAFNLESHLEIIRYSPGIEEYALLMGFEYYAEKYSGKDLLIFDMPPTALTLKFLNLPQLSLLWLQKLIELRQKIIEKREIVSKIKFGKKEIESDRVLRNLSGQYAAYQKIKALFADHQKTELIIVMNPDRLAISETELIMDKLAGFELSANQIILNKHDSAPVSLPKKLEHKALKNLPFSISPLVGLEQLDKYLVNLKMNLS